MQWENRLSALRRSRQWKVTKYSPGWTAILQIAHFLLVQNRRLRLDKPSKHCFHYDLFIIFGSSYQLVSGGRYRASASWWAKPAQCRMLNLSSMRLSPNLVCLLELFFKSEIHVDTLRYVRTANRLSSMQRLSSTTAYSTSKHSRWVDSHCLSASWKARD